MHNTHRSLSKLSVIILIIPSTGLALPVFLRLSASCTVIVMGDDLV